LGLFQGIEDLAIKTFIPYLAATEPLCLIKQIPTVYALKRYIDITNGPPKRT